MMINQKSPYFLYHLGRLSEIVAVFSLSSPMTPCSLPGSIIQWGVWTRSPRTLELVHPLLWHRVDFSTLESTTLRSLLPLYFNDFFFFFCLNLLPSSLNDFPKKLDISSEIESPSLIFPKNSIGRDLFWV